MMEGYGTLWYGLPNDGRCRARSLAWRVVLGGGDPAAAASRQRLVVVDPLSVSSPVVGLRDDAAGVRDALDSLTDDAVRVGHSYGGSVVTQAGIPARVAHLVYLTAFGLEIGESPVATISVVVAAELCDDANRIGDGV